MRILVIGAGAVGGFFGARLQNAGRDVTFLVRARRAEQLSKDGLHVTSPKGDLHITPQLLLANELKASPQAFDLILLSTKAYSLDDAIADFAPAVGPGTAILPLLNGMRHIDTLIARFGDEHILGGSTRIVADMDSDGHIHSMETLQDLVFGELDRANTERIQAIAATMQDCGFDDKLSPDILSFMWQKWVLLSSLGSITCLMRGTIGQAAAIPEGIATARGIVHEAATIAAAEGYPQSPDFLEMITGRLTKLGSTLTASMYRDLTKGQPVEADQIVGDLISRGTKHNLASPLLTAAYANLCVYSQSR